MNCPACDGKGFILVRDENGTPKRDPYTHIFITQECNSCPNRTHSETTFEALKNSFNKGDWGRYVLDKKT